MSITSKIFENLNEGVETKVVTKYGDKPQEGSKVQETKHSSVKVPSGKQKNDFKPVKLENKNKQATDIYASDTDKYVDKLKDKSEKTTVKAPTLNKTKAEKTVKFPYGDKVQKSDSKLIKESEEIEEAVAGRYSDDILIAVEDGFLSYEDVARAALKYMSEDDLKDMAKSNDWSIAEDWELEECDKSLKESDGWIAVFGNKKCEVTKDEAKDLYSAKKKAIEKLSVPKNKENMVSIEPAYNEENIDDAPASNAQFN